MEVKAASHQAQDIHLVLAYCRIGIVQGQDPSGPHDALKHHFTSLETDLIFLQLRVLKFP